MKTPGLNVCTLLVCCIAFAACTNATPPQEMPIRSSATHVTGSEQRPGPVRHASATETVLYRFGSSRPDGGSPVAGLTYVNGTMYGVTSFGSPFKPVLYSITPSGTYTILHEFTLAEAYELDGGLTAVGRNPVRLFGTGSGDASLNGTVFKSTLKGRITVLHSFQNSPGDGATPLSSLVNVNGTLYGTTFAGGTSGKGTVFSITPSGSYKVIYNFAGGNDGASPSAGLAELNGTLYGTTLAGGQPNGCIRPLGCGTVFSITAAGKESVLHRFLGGSNDGARPVAPLVSVNGMLYGTTAAGGSGCPTSVASGCGTVFRITRAGRESVLYKFSGSPDGATPKASLLYVRGAMYGTTYNGGTGCQVSTANLIPGCGTVFRITRSGAETILHRFADVPDGAHPHSGLIDVNGTLYGTTVSGGGDDFSGTIYSITL